MVRKNVYVSNHPAPGVGFDFGGQRPSKRRQSRRLSEYDTAIEDEDGLPLPSSTSKPSEDESVFLNNDRDDGGLDMPSTAVRNRRKRKVSSGKLRRVRNRRRADSNVLNIPSTAK